MSVPVLLLDENLSPRLAAALAADYPGTCHVSGLGLQGEADREVWAYARKHGFVIVSKDNDFRQLSFLYGAPPKVVWLRIGNAPTQAVFALLTARKAAIVGFAEEDETALLILRP